MLVLNLRSQLQKRLPSLGCFLLSLNDLYSFPLDLQLACSLRVFPLDLNELSVSLLLWLDTSCPLLDTVQFSYDQRFFEDESRWPIVRRIVDRSTTVQFHTTADAACSKKLLSIFELWKSPRILSVSGPELRSLVRVLPAVGMARLAANLTSLSLKGIAQRELYVDILASVHWKVLTSLCIELAPIELFSEIIEDFVTPCCPALTSLILHLEEGDDPLAASPVCGFPYSEATVSNLSRLHHLGLSLSACSVDLLSAIATRPNCLDSLELAHGSLDDRNMRCLLFLKRTFGQLKTLTSLSLTALTDTEMSTVLKGVAAWNSQRFLLLRSLCVERISQSNLALLQSMLLRFRPPLHVLELSRLQPASLVRDCISQFTDAQKEERMKGSARLLLYKLLICAEDSAMYPCGADVVIE